MSKTAAFFSGQIVNPVDLDGTVDTDLTGVVVRRESTNMFRVRWQNGVLLVHNHRQLRLLSSGTFSAVKDSGKRQEYPSGMRRDTQEGKPRFDLLLTHDLPFERQMLTREARLMEAGADKYGARNFELANSAEELERFKSSAFRHFVKWLSGETDEDHAAMAAFNIRAAEDTRARIELGITPEEPDAADDKKDAESAG